MTPPGIYFLANSLLFGKGNNSAKIEIGEEIEEGVQSKCVHEMGKKLMIGREEMNTF